MACQLSLFTQRVFSAEVPQIFIKRQSSDQSSDNSYKKVVWKRKRNKLHQKQKSTTAFEVFWVSQQDTTPWLMRRRDIVRAKSFEKRNLIF